MRHQIADLYSTNPNRPVDWKYQLAEWYAAGDPPALAHGWDDPIIDRAIRVLRGEGSDEPVLAASRLRDGPAVDRAEIEARIVAGQSCDVIASEMVLPAPVLAVFESLFFDVRGRIQSCPGLVLPDTRVPLVPGDVRGLLMLAAIRPGPIPVGWLAWYFRAELDRDVRINQIPGLSPGERERAQQIRKWVRSKTLSKNPMTIMKTLYAVRRREMRSEMRATRKQPEPPAAAHCQKC